jgi:chromosomal replication initiation ATPase DnaA
MEGILNYYNIGIPICTNGAKTVFLSENPVEDGVNWLVAKNGTMFQHVVNKETERQILYISASSGAGKSHYALGFAQAYHKAYPKRPIYLFSYLDQCDTLDKCKAIKRVKIKEPNFLTDEIEAVDLKESLVIMDDCDCISDKKIKKRRLRY